MGVGEGKITFKETAGEGTPRRFSFFRATGIPGKNIDSAAGNLRIGDAMKNPRALSLLSPLAVILVSGNSAGAATWMSDFDGVGDDTFQNIVGSASIDSTNDWLVVTSNSDNQTGTAYVPDLTTGFAAAMINATFDINQSLGDDADEADGAALFFGEFANTTSALTDGFSLTNGLRLRFHIENNTFGSGVDEAISIFYNDSEIFTTQLALTTDVTDFRAVSLTVDAVGAYNVTYNGAGFANSSGTIPGWAPASGWQYAVGGRTGGRNANQFLDNMVLSANVVPEPSSALLAALGLAGIAMKRRR